MRNKVIIVGGGVAGISAAVELAKSNIPVQLIEAKNYIGGRCFSFVDRFTGDEIDNGQHIFIGAYHNFLNCWIILELVSLLFHKKNLR